MCPEGLGLAQRPPTGDRMIDGEHPEAELGVTQVYLRFATGALQHLNKMSSTHSIPLGTFS